MLDVAIIGGGPAAQAAALQLARHPLAVAVFDEQQRPGGQILRQPATGGPPAGYGALGAQLSAFEALQLDWRGGHSVLGIAAIDDGFRIDAVGPEGLVRTEARKLLVAAGCQDVAVPLPGWTLPGVMAAGGLQALLKAQRLVPGKAVLLAGTHPLMLLIADQITSAGGRVAGVLFAQTRAAMAGVLAADPVTALGGLANLRDAAAAWRRLRTAGVPVRFGAELAELQGTDRVASATLAGSETIACDTVGLCFGFVPQSDLVRAIGAEVVAAGGAGGWRATADVSMQSSVPGLYVAGETIGVAGAPAAAAGGTIAGISIAAALGMAAGDATPFRRAFEKTRRFGALLDRIADPTAYWPQVTLETLACRCENVAFGTLEDALATAVTANTIKRLTRCGMGVCQGRNCEPTLLRMLAERGHRADPGFAARYPARPVAIGDLIG